MKARHAFVHPRTPQALPAADSSCRSASTFSRSTCGQWAQLPGEAPAHSSSRSCTMPRSLVSRKAQSTHQRCYGATILRAQERLATNCSVFDVNTACLPRVERGEAVGTSCFASPEPEKSAGFGAIHTVRRAPRRKRNITWKPPPPLPKPAQSTRGHPENCTNRRKLRT